MDRPVLIRPLEELRVWKGELLSDCREARSLRCSGVPKGLKHSNYSNYDHNNFSLPTIYHYSIYSTGAARGRRQTIACVYQLDYLLFVSIIILVRIIYSLNSYFIVGNGFKGFVSHTPYLVHESSITPHITSTGVLLIIESLHKQYNSIVNQHSVIKARSSIPQVLSISQGSSHHVRHSSFHSSIHVTFQSQQSLHINMNIYL